MKRNLARKSILSSCIFLLVLSSFSLSFGQNLPRFQTFLTDVYGNPLSEGRCILRNNAHNREVAALNAEDGSFMWFEAPKLGDTLIAFCEGFQTTWLLPQDLGVWESQGAVIRLGKGEEYLKMGSWKLPFYWKKGLVGCTLKPGSTRKAALFIKKMEKSGWEQVELWEEDLENEALEYPAENVLFFRTKEDGQHEAAAFFRKMQWEPDVQAFGWLIKSGNSGWKLFQPSIFVKETAVSGPNQISAEIKGQVYPTVDPEMLEIWPEEVPNAPEAFFNQFVKAHPNREFFPHFLPVPGYPLQRIELTVTDLKGGLLPALHLSLESPVPHENPKFRFDSKSGKWIAKSYLHPGNRLKISMPGWEPLDCPLAEVWPSGKVIMGYSGCHYFYGKAHFEDSRRLSVVVDTTLKPLSETRKDLVTSLLKVGYIPEDLSGLTHRGKTVCWTFLWKAREPVPASEVSELLSQKSEVVAFGPGLSLDAVFRPFLILSINENASLERVANHLQEEGLGVLKKKNEREWIVSVPPEMQFRISSLVEDMRKSILFYKVNPGLWVPGSL